MEKIVFDVSQLTAAQRGDLSAFCLKVGAKPVSGANIASVGAWKAMGKLPPMDEVVMLFNAQTGYASLGCRADTGDGWLWAEANGTFFASADNRLCSDCELLDNEFTHWHSLPKLPTI